MFSTLQKLQSQASPSQNPSVSWSLGNSVVEDHCSLSRQWVIGSQVMARAARLVCWVTVPMARWILLGEHTFSYNYMLWSLFPNCLTYRKTQLIADKLGCCASFGWGSANFLKILYTVWYETMFWICVGNVRDVFITAEQYFHRVKAFSAFNPTPPSRKWGCTRSWEKAQSEQLTSGIFHTTGCHAQHIQLGK